MKSNILDKNGNNFIYKSISAPNLDSEFWSINSNNQNIETILKQPYEYYVWVFSCVNTIASNLSQIEHYISNKSNEEIIPNHYIMNIFNKPNNIMTRSIFIQTIVAKLLLPDERKSSSSGGQCFIVPWISSDDRPAILTKGEIPDELMPFSESWFKPWKEKNKHGLENNVGWIFDVPGTVKIKFKNNEIIRIFLLNPYDTLKGISPFSSVAYSVNLDIKSDIYNDHIFDNSGQLDGLVTSDNFIPQTELDNLKDNWYKQYTGTNRKRVAFLTGALKYQQLGLSPNDLKNLDNSKWIRQKILAAYRLNRIAIGDYEDINFATIREGRKLLWYDTYIPLDKLIIDAFNYQWINYIDKNQVLMISDYSKIPALQSDFKDKVTTGGMLVQQMGFPPVLAARLIGIQLRQEDLEKWPYLNDRLTQSNTGFDGNEQIISIKSKNFDIKQKNYEYSKNYIKSVLFPVENKFQKNLNAYFIKQRNLILDKVDNLVKSGKSFIEKDIAVSGWEFLPDESSQVFDLLKMHKQAAKLQTALEKKQVENELHRGIEWDVDGTQIDYWVSVRAGDMRKIVSRNYLAVRNVIDATVKQGMNEGVDVNEMRNRIKDAVQTVYDVRLGKPVVPNGLFDLGGMSSSKTIARTEMGSIASLTRIDIFKQEGIEKIEWITAHDERVRDSHVKINGQSVKFGQDFDNGLRFPRDPNGPPEEIINCRCSFIAVIED
jgi:SPP1 gp7 family putative phage head morphogenesis protein